MTTTKKVALVTGANKGIGFEVAAHLARTGCTVLLGARNPELGRQAASKLQNDQLDARFIELDLARKETIDAAFAWEFAPVKYLGYCASKAALNMLTVQLAYELREAGIKVNSADPGYTATDLNGNQGHQTVEEGAAVVIRLALLEADGPTGGFFANPGPDPW